MRIFILVFLSSLMLYSAKAQDFYFHGGVDYLLIPDKSSEAMQNNYSYNVYNPFDSTASVRTVNQNFKYNYEHTELPVIRLGVGVRFSLSNKLELESGLGAEVLSFNRTTDFEITESLISEVEIPFEPLSFNTGFNLCDRYTNELSNVATPERGIDYRLAYLKIPVSFYFEIVPDELKLSLGSYISTPFYTLLRDNDRINTHRESLDDQVVCTYVTQDDDTSGDGLNNLLTGLNLGVEYWLDRVGFEVRADKKFGNVINPKSNFITNQEIENISEPTQLGVSVKFKLGKDPVE